MQDEIKAVVHSICHYLPKSIKTECDNFVNQYGDAMIQLLIESLDPAEVCTELKLCTPHKTMIHGNNQHEK